MVDYRNAYGSIANTEVTTDETLDLVDAFSTITCEDISESIDALFGEPCNVDIINVERY